MYFHVPFLLQKKQAMKKEKINLAIYDELKLEKELLHHQLERMQYQLLFSSTDAGVVIENSRFHIPDVLLVNGMTAHKKSERLISLIRKKNRKLTVVYYNIPSDAALAAKLKKKYEAEVYFSDDGWKGLIGILEGLHGENGVPEHNNHHRLSLAADNPFRKIIPKKHYIEILALLEKGKGAKEISIILGLPYQTVKTYISRMHNDTGYHTNVEMVGEAVRCHVI